MPGLHMIRVRPGSLSTSPTCASAPWRQQGAALLLHGLPTQTRLTPPRDGRLPGRDMEVSKESRVIRRPALPHGCRDPAHIYDDRIVTAWARAGVRRIATARQASKASEASIVVKPEAATRTEGGARDPVLGPMPGNWTCSQSPD